MGEKQVFRAILMENSNLSDYKDTDLGKSLKLMLICVHKLRKARHDIPATVLVCNGLFEEFLM